MVGRTKFVMFSPLFLGLPGQAWAVSQACDFLKVEKDVGISSLNPVIRTRNSNSPTSSEEACETSAELEEVNSNTAEELEKTVEELKDKTTNVKLQTELSAPLAILKGLSSDRAMMKKLGDLNKKNKAVKDELLSWGKVENDTPDQARRKIYKAVEILSSSLTQYSRGLSLSGEKSTSKRPRLNKTFLDLLDAAYLDKDLWSCVTEKLTSPSDNEYAHSILPVELDLVPLTKEAGTKELKPKKEEVVLKQVRSDLFSDRGQQAYLIGLDGGEEKVSFGSLFNQEVTRSKGSATQDAIKEKLTDQILAKMVERIKKTESLTEELEKQLNQIFQYSDETAKISNDLSRRAKKFAIYTLNMATQEGFNAFLLSMGEQKKSIKGLSVNTYIDFRKERRDPTSNAVVYGNSVVNVFNLMTNKMESKSSYGVEYSVGALDEKNEGNPLRMGKFKMIALPSSSSSK